MSGSASPAPRPYTPAFDRGEARYFHGRDNVLKKFRTFLNRSKPASTGTTMMIQAAPGAGKTALLTECARIAGLQGWQVAEMEPIDLLDANELHNAVRSSWKVWRPWLKGMSAGINVGLASVEVEFGRKASTPLAGLKEGTTPLLLLLDEAQELIDIPSEPPLPFMRAKSLLTSIHNGRVTRPVILIAAGLGGTGEAFTRLAMSRSGKGYQIDLAPLRKTPTRAVIQDWLIEEGGAKGDPTIWIDAIAPETHGWPQHIMAYVEPAIDYLKAHTGQMTPAGLDAVIHEGREARKEYYEGRVSEFIVEERETLARALARPGPNEFRYTDILESLSKDVGSERAEQIFVRALHKGVIDKQRGYFVVPIPSMYDWLQQEYGPGRGTLNRSSGRHIPD